ncbi:hypothetical protein LHYA1_G004042 [Lachnellula hyalina]|uniref:Uncharacterized protein n=1 Tax=Lachnellula hyalina TaxID=1316788 RepID=A0A8H8U159_9HELO|nr:uncharacterized protein LHYA1_G004042 [Lachnellula hyalina]TVY27577.1 hypothetical protein LHYA1_G004042 [Lachnellula hyalina]
MSSKMIRHPSHASSSNSTSSPKSRSRFFFKRERGTSMSRSVFSTDTSNGDINKEVEPNHSEDNIPNSLFPDLELTRSSGFPSPDPYVPATHDFEYLHLKENIRRIRKAPSGSDPKKVDHAWEVYKKLKDKNLQLCQSLLHKSQNTGRNASMDISIGPLDTRSSHSTESSLPFQVNDQWRAAIHEYKATQEQMLENLRNSLLAIYRSYEPEVSEQQLETFLSDKTIRRNMISKWRDTSVHALKSEKPLFWEQYKIRSLNLDRLKLDLQATEKLFEVAETGTSENLTIREYVIAQNGDMILEFPYVSETHPVLRFRVSSHLLAESSPIFSQMILPQQAGKGFSLDLMNQLPPAPTKQICKDGMEVKVYRMPQAELNHNEALTILLHAAHMHNAKVPREIEYPVFVSIAEVCLKYQCTSPLELQVEYQWLPQWVHKAADPNPDGFLLISYAFGIRRIFTRVTKTAILNALSDAETQSKELWPQAIRDKIKAIRAAKLAQIHECCTNAIEDYFRPPSEHVNRTASLGSLLMTTEPRCPKGSHLCDATNLGWLMLVYNELRMLPSIMNNTGFHNIPPSPQRSLKDLVDCLRLMPSAPQVHSGVCDYAPAFRCAIGDIYNSISGFTLRDVTGRNGWALSKHAGSTEDRYDDNPRDVVELGAPLPSPRKAKWFRSSSNESVSLRVLSQIDNLEDLSSAAMIDKTFYSAYKRNEASLLKNVMKAERRRTISQINPEILVFRNSRAVNSDDLSVSTNTKSVDSKLRSDKRHSRSVPQVRIDTSGEELYDGSSSYSPTDSEVTTDPKAPMSSEEAERILWPNDESKDDSPRPNTGPNEKFLMGGSPHIEMPRALERNLEHVEEKTRMVEDEKHLREEKEAVFGVGPSKKPSTCTTDETKDSDSKPYDAKDCV